MLANFKFAGREYSSRVCHAVGLPRSLSDSLAVRITHLPSRHKHESVSSGAVFILSPLAVHGHLFAESKVVHCWEVFV